MGKLQTETSFDVISNLDQVEYSGSLAEDINFVKIIKGKKKGSYNVFTIIEQINRIVDKENELKSYLRDKFNIDIMHISIGEAIVATQILNEKLQENVCCKPKYGIKTITSYIGIGLNKEDGDKVILKETRAYKKRNLLGKKLFESKLEIVTGEKALMYKKTRDNKLVFNNQIFRD